MRGNYLIPMAFDLGSAMGGYTAYANDMKNRQQLEDAYATLLNGGNLTDEQMARNINNMGNVTVGDVMRNGGNPQPQMTSDQMAQSIGNFARNNPVTVGAIMNGVTNGRVPQANTQASPQMSREDMLKANGSLMNENGMPILSAAGNQIMSDKLMYEHFLNQGQPEVAQKYADHANYVREHLSEINGDVPLESYLQSASGASYADSQDYLNGKKLYSAVANQALQNTPQNVNPAQASPQVAQTAPTVNSNVMATPTTAQAVAGNGYNFSAPTVGEIARGLSNGGFYGNFLMGRK